MARLLIGMDESLRLGMTAEQLSSVGSELSPAEYDKFQESMRCLELLHHFRPQNPAQNPSQTDLNDSTFDDDLPSAHDLAFEGTDRYRVQQVLGAGAMGVVYEVYDEHRQTTAALKKLRQTEPSRILRFKEEFRRLANVAHHNVVTLFELVQVENDWFIAMELVDGTDFLATLALRNIRDELMSSAGRSPRALGQLCDLFQQLAAGLQALHLAGILHRDLKPNNVLVTPDDRVVIIDFGLATDFDWRRLQGTSLPEFAGTYAYMAPEQVVCQPLTPACDWYSFGVMFYQALTGELPIGGPYSLHTKQYLPPPSLQQQLPGLPPGWAELGQALLAPEPSARPTGIEVRERLRELQATASKTQDPTFTNWASLRGNAQESRGLFGRDLELKQLRAAMRFACDGRPIVVTVHGTSGIGKTTLVEGFLSEFADDVSNLPIVSLRGRCHERESLPYKSLDSLVDSLCKYLSGLTTDELQDLLPRNMSLLCRVFPVLNAVKTITPRAQVAEESMVAEPDADPIWLRRRAFDALRELLLAIAQNKPLLLFIDDLQWGDVPGASALSELFHSNSTAKMMWILAYRAEQSSTNACLNGLHLEKLPTLARHPDISIPSSPRFAHQEIALGPLNSDESAQLAANLLEELQCGSGTQALHEAIAVESGGMPFYVQELVRHTIGTKEPDHEFLPGKVEERISLNSVLRDRVAALPDSDRQVMSMVAIAGQPISIDLVCQAMNMPTVDERQLHQLSVNRWLRSNRESHQNMVTVFHDQIRESILSSLTLDVKQQLHIDLADSLERSHSTTPETLAYHFDAGNEPRRAGHYLRLAGKNAQNVFAFEKAIEHFRRALELSSTPAARYEMSRSLGEACSQAGRGGEAATALLQAAELAPPSEAIELRLAAARQYCISGYTDEGRRLVRSILAASGMYFPKGFMGLVASLLYQRARLAWQGLKVSLRPEAEVASTELQRIDMMWSAVSGLSFQEPVAVASLHTQGLRAALVAGEPKRVVRALALEAILSATPGPKTRPRVERLLEQTSSLAASSTDSDTLGMLNLAKGGTAFLQVRMPDAVAPLIEAEKLFSSRVPKAWWELTTARSLLAWAYMHMGDFCSLKRCLELYQQDAQDRGDLFLLSSIRGAGIPQLQLAADQPELAQEGLDRLEQSVPYKQFQQRHVSMLYSQAQIDLYQGNGLASWKRIHDNWSLFRKSMQLQNQFARVSLIDLRARCALSAFKQDADPRLLKCVRADLTRLKREVGTWIQPFVSRLEAGIHEAQGAPDQAQAWLERASQEFAAIGFKGCALGAQRKQGQMMNNSIGLQLIAEADSFFKTQAVVDAEAFQRVLC